MVSGYTPDDLAPVWSCRVRTPRAKVRGVEFLVVSQRHGPYVYGYLRGSNHRRMLHEDDVVVGSIKPPPPGWRDVDFKR